MNNLLKRIIIAVVSLALVCGYAFGFYKLNSRFPKASITECPVGDTLNYRGADLQILSAELATVEEVRKLYPLFMSDEDPVMTPLPEDQVRVLLVSMEVSNPSDAEQVATLYTSTAVSDSWSNGIHQFLFQEINEEGASLNALLAPGETRTVLLPYIMTEQQFKANDWDNIESRPYQLILETYPEKLIMDISVSHTN